MRFPRRGLYALLDIEVLARAHAALDTATDAVVTAGAKVVQLRAKALSARETLACLKRVVATVSRRALVFANDRADLACLAGADGVHVGQYDLTVAEVRRIAPKLLVGVSTHTEREFDDALDAHPDYVSVGPIFDTLTKKNAEPTIGVDAARAWARRAMCPVVAIGGIDERRAQKLADRFVICVASALLARGPSHADIVETTRRLVALSGR